MIVQAKGEGGEILLSPILETTPDVTDLDVMDEVGRAMHFLAGAPGAIGVAAPQLGIRRRFYVIREGDEMVVYHNPVLTVQGTKLQVGTERCLSLPDAYRVTRAQCVRVQAVDVIGEPVDFLAHGHQARIHQHETDHLDGVLISSRGHRLP